MGVAFAGCAGRGFKSSNLGKIRIESPLLGRLLEMEFKPARVGSKITVKDPAVPSPKASISLHPLGINSQ
ncbi:hypothetical protein M413DRAFT_438282 [Hebeloma cylindrosporum]|uniref:Uncharacterized protein n=1 Tax=Hebeloma cylindrosporum TaxID=76867 RepID=A0A0C2YHD9_HEBCY|nr:hypothetical protein M413DRAFT_438282 [Hebeloma cylindrosporum h7]